MRRTIVLQFARYCTVGVLALGADVGCFLALRAMSLGLVPANVVARLVGAIAAYGGNHLWTFDGSPKLEGWLHSAWRYVVLWFGATLFSTLLLSGLTNLGQGEAPSKVGVEILIVVINFFISRHWVFR